MSSVKALLKSAKAAIGAKNWEEAESNAQAALAQDSSNYHALLFLGKAKQQKKELGESEKAYTSATLTNPQDVQAWLGLRELFESQGAAKVNDYTKVGLKLAEIYGTSEDLNRGQSSINKLVDFARKHGTPTQYFEALQTQLPTSTVYSYLEGRLPRPADTYVRLAEISEREEEQRIATAISERRTRIGARVAQVTIEVKREVYGASSLEHIYEQIINWTHDDDVRRAYEEKLFNRAYATLEVLPAAEKEAKRQQVMKLAHDMVVIKHPLLLAWDAELEWADVEELDDLDPMILQQFIDFFPEEALSSVLRAFMSSEFSPWPVSPKTEASDGEEETKVVDLTAEDRMLLMADHLEKSDKSCLSYRIVGYFYGQLEEHELAIQANRKALKILEMIQAVTGLELQANEDSLKSSLSTALIYHQAPRHHQEAKTSFEAILRQKPQFTPALIGVGLILEEEEEYGEAVEFLDKALARDPTNFRIGAEAAWCRARNGDMAAGVVELQRFFRGMLGNDTRGRELKAQTLYRIGVCKWESDASKASRKDRKAGPYADFLAAIKTNPSCAPAYTSLGTFYESYANDKKRARQCFQKAFELSVAETAAAEHLARIFADSGDWEIVEVIAKRVVDSGRAKPAPGSKKKGLSWPFSALGVVQMNRQDYQQAIVSFLAALRISPLDYHSYVGLGESYHNSGRYNSALRAFEYAQNPPEGVVLQGAQETWFTKYMLANVHRELGDFEEAIEGYRSVLSERPKEFGVGVSLLQALVERALRAVQTGFLGLAADNAREALEVALSITSLKPEAFNLWKAVGDACSVFSWVQRRSGQFPLDVISRLLELDSKWSKYDYLTNVDRIDLNSVKEYVTAAEATENGTLTNVKLSLVVSILAHKRAVAASAQDIHAQAVSWYNLGWAEYRAHSCLRSSDKDSKVEQGYLNAAVRSFKRAIELEASNAQFWNALGAVTMTKSAKIAQHAFVRSLHLNEMNPAVWTNLGTLYLLQDDLELAHQAFTRAQSTDPDYPAAWVGEGVLAVLWNKPAEANLHFAHAFEISGADSAVVKQKYATSAFDAMLKSRKDVRARDLVGPLHAMAQLHNQELTPDGLPYTHLLALLHERVGNFAEASATLVSVADDAERDYEENESGVALFQYASAKADLARNMLGAKDFVAAAEAAQLALDLTDDEIEGCAADAVTKIRLSAHLTLGLASFHQRSMEDAVAAFSAALTESANDPDVVCLLSQVLWAQGGEREHSVARDQLFESIEKNVGHVGSVCLLGVMGVLDRDVGVCEAARDELRILRAAVDVSEAQRANVETVLEAVVAHLAVGEARDGVEGVKMHDALTGVAAEEMNEVQASILMGPANPGPWSRLADLVSAAGGDGDVHGQEGAESEMALRAVAVQQAMRGVPPRGNVGEEELARVLARAGSIAEAQRAVCVAPWRADGWQALAEMCDVLGV